MSARRLASAPPGAGSKASGSKRALRFTSARSPWQRQMRSGFMPMKEYRPRAAFDGFEEKAVRPPIGKLEHGRDGRFEIGDQRGPDQHRPARGVVLRERVEAGAELHASRLRRRAGPRSR